MVQKARYHKLNTLLLFVTCYHCMGSAMVGMLGSCHKHNSAIVIVKKYWTGEERAKCDLDTVPSRYSSMCIPVCGRLHCVLIHRFALCGGPLLGCSTKKYNCVRYQTNETSADLAKLCRMLLLLSYHAMPCLMLTSHRNGKMCIFTGK